LTRKGRAGSSPAIGTKNLSGQRLLDLIQKPFSRFEDQEPLRVIYFQSERAANSHVYVQNGQGSRQFVTTVRPKHSNFGVKVRAAARKWLAADISLELKKE
jgi:hypothetical protein